MVLAFLQHIEAERKNGPVTRNARLAAIKSFMRYIEYQVPSALEQVRQILAIPIKKTDTKRHKFTIMVTADDVTVEKKDRNINEPIQFYVSKARQPYEVVVNEVRKDQIVGYLASPKVQTSRN